MAMSEFEAIRFRREELGQILQGPIDRVPVEKNSLSEFISRGRSGELTCVWRRSSGELPVLLTGKSDDLADACAWSAAYLTGVGPLSGIMRILPSEAVNSNTFSRDGGDIGHVEPRIAHLFVGLIFGELYARASPGSRSVQASLTAATSSLSFALARACLQPHLFSLEQVFNRWQFARDVTRSSITHRIDECVKEVSRELASPNLLTTSMGPGQLALARSRSLDLNKILDSDAQSELARIDKEPAEARVRIADKLLAQVAMSDAPLISRGLGAAYIARKATNNYLAQRGLIEPVFEKLPEASVWLGLMQGDEPLGQLLGTEGGLGWRVLARIEERVDFLARPTCDISVDELRIYSGAHRSELPGTTSRVVVEIIPGVNATLSKPGSQSDKAAKRPPKRSYKQSDTLDAVSESLEAALQAIAELRNSRR